MTRANARTSVRDHDERGLVGGAWCRRARRDRICYRSASGRSAKGEHEAAMNLKAVPGIGAEIMLAVDGEWRRTGLFRSHEQAEHAPPAGGGR
jgi:hypothetical protein